MLLSYFLNVISDSSLWKPPPIGGSQLHRSHLLRVGRAEVDEKDDEREEHGSKPTIVEEFTHAGLLSVVDLADTDDLGVHRRHVSAARSSGS